MGAITVDTEAVARQVTAKRKEIEDLVAALGAKYTVQILLPPSQSDILGWFHNGTPRPSATRQPARPVLTVNDYARREMITTLAQRFLADPRPLNVLPSLTIAGSRLREVWVERLESGGLDMTWKRLAPSTLDRKRRLGQPLHPGVATGTLARAMRGAQIVVSRAR